MHNIVRRCTLVVRDARRARDFYASVLGLALYYDRSLTLSGQGVPGRPGDRVHLVIMKADDPAVGMVGLMEYVSPRKPEPPPQPDGLGIGGTVLVVGTDDAEALHARAVEWGVRIHSPPHRLELSGADGQPLVMTSTCFYDPDGYFIEANQRHPRAAPAGDG